MIEMQLEHKEVEDELSAKRRQGREDIGHRGDIAIIRGRCLPYHLDNVRPGECLDCAEAVGNHGSAGAKAPRMVLPG